MAEDAEGARAGPVGLLLAVGQDVVEEVEVLPHVRKRNPLDPQSRCRTWWRGVSGCGGRGTAKDSTPGVSAGSRNTQAS
ncbi:hypothetical protein GCM10009740_30070 [Terrabacter terrae]|uniref:Uncharacterized protein n=1 Tax=Terrabacter terrae TaxID=318434 RepID=A0ABP5G169_9MICO